MSNIVQMTKAIGEPGASAVQPEYSLRTFGEADDCRGWLTLRATAFAAESPGAGAWQTADFHRAFNAQWWWRPEWQWFAHEVCDPTAIVGSITLALRGSQRHHVAVVHWLMVAPEHRGRGIAHGLLAKLEQTAYQAGFRELHLETHANWRRALRFYESAGFTSVKK